MVAAVVISLEMEVEAMKIRSAETSVREKRHQDRMLGHFSTARVIRRNSQETNREMTIRIGGRKGECEVMELKRRVLQKVECAQLHQMLLR